MNDLKFITDEQIEVIADLFAQRESLLVGDQGIEWLLSHAFQLGMKLQRDMILADIQEADQ